MVVTQISQTLPQFFLDRMESPLGSILMVIDTSNNLRALDWSDYEARMHGLLDRHYGKARYALRQGSVPGEIKDRLQRYFEGEWSAIEQLPVATGGTDFQREVWSALRCIPAGQTLTYGELACAIGRPKAVRAVGLANGANPVGIVVPCHRIIGAKAALTGYAGGLHRKEWLLKHERSRPQGLL